MGGLLKWDEREAYEKIIMGLLGLGLIFVFFWFAVVNPVLSAKSDARLQSDKAQRDYDIVMQALPVLGSGGVQASGQPFSRPVLLAAARNKNIRLTRVQPDGEAINVWIDDVETSKIYGLINALITQNGAVLSRATITASNNGLLSAQLTLQ